MRYLTFTVVSLLTTSLWAARNKEIPADAAGMVARTEGTVTGEVMGKKRHLHAGDAIINGEVIATADASKVKVLLADDSVLNLGPKTRFEIGKVEVKEGSRTISMKIITGKFMAAVSRWFGGGGNNWQVETPTAVAGVRGTVLWGDTQLDAICALYGTIEVKSLSGGDGTNVKLDAGNCASKMAQGKTEPLKPTPEEVAKYLSEVTISR